MKRITLPICNFFVILLAASVLLFAVACGNENIANNSDTSVSVQPDLTRYNHAVDAWENCLRQLNIDADIVFIGDSITKRGNFAEMFPDKTVCNLGIGSDTIENVINRTSMISAVNPETIFLLVGINSLHDDTLEECIADYSFLIQQITSQCDANLYTISVMPISVDKAKESKLSQETIVTFNTAIENATISCNAEYIDLYSLLENNGSIDPKYTTDGIHLSDEAYQIWKEQIIQYID